MQLKKLNFFHNIFTSISKIPWATPGTSANVHYSITVMLKQEFIHALSRGPSRSIFQLTLLEEPPEEEALPAFMETQAYNSLVSQLIIKYIIQIIYNFTTNVNVNVCAIWERIRVFATNSNVLIPISLEPDGVNLCFFKI